MFKGHKITYSIYHIILNFSISQSLSLLKLNMNRGLDKSTHIHCHS